MSDPDPIIDQPAPPKKPAVAAKPAAAESAAPEQVKARFVDVQAVYSPTQGVIRYGDEFMVSAEQLDQDPRFIPWSDNWTADPALLAASELEG